MKSVPSVNQKLNEIYEDKENYYKNETTKMVNFRIHLIQQLVILAVENFLNNLDAIENGTYHKELIYDDKYLLAKKLKNICIEKVFKYRDINSLELTGNSVLKGLLNYYINFLFHKNKDYRKRAIRMISSSILNVAFEENELEGEKAKFENLPDYYKLRVIVDFISGMTDQFALTHYQKINGQKIN